MMTLSDRMKSEAISNGLCEQWTNEWKDNSSKHEMAEKFIKGIDFCIKHNFPSIDVIKKDFGDVMHSHGVYCDEEVHIDNAKGIIVLCGDCSGDITVTDYVCEVYIRHTSHVTIKANVGSKVWVNLCDASRCYISTDRFSKAYVHNYNDCSVVYDGNVSIKNRKGFFG